MSGSQTAADRMFVPTDSMNRLVWDSLRRSLITASMLQSAPGHIKGGYVWDMAQYEPVVHRDEEGAPVFTFART